ncbi:hypothetical protein GCM10011390_12350 [Aureimonas endophytica]|uniref:Tetratricopeptide repeat protein n=1 Tax=Aureimonas endophytica TaxID=2027858 RepID=A0A916ZFN3_9HYPH|nr:hypothetical protein [Aureimonas endophytica]GGD95133.1 hypothetical protein GCM10011390_12350 [Aureimonas endophytica]
MRALLFCLPLLLLAAVPPAPAQTGANSPAEPALPRGAGPSGGGRGAPSGETPLKAPEEPGAQARRLDALFAELKQEASATKAAAIAEKINAEWGRSGSATVDLLVQRATLAMAKQDGAAALDFLDQALVLDPDYAEAWNRRATLNYTNDDYGKSLDDIRQTLRLEPRHYGALMGFGAILEETDRKPQALQTYLKVLELYPTLKPAQDAVARLSDELAGQAL